MTDLFSEFDLSHIIEITISTFPASIPSLAAFFIALWTNSKVSRVTNEVSLVKADINKIEVATNSMKDALIKATAKSSLAEGIVQGLAQGRIEEQERRDKEKEERKGVVSVEYLLVASLMIAGVTVAFQGLRDQLIGSANDVGFAIRSHIRANLPNTIDWRRRPIIPLIQPLPTTIVQPNITQSTPIIQQTIDDYCLTP